MVNLTINGLAELASELPDSEHWYELRIRIKKTGTGILADVVVSPAVKIEVVRKEDGHG
jgi:hypothetical protein